MPQVTGRIDRVLLAGLILVGVVSILDSTIVVPLLTRIGDAFDGGVDGGSQPAWLISGYLLASTLSVPFWGRWHDLRGERAPMWTALALFTLGSFFGIAAFSLDALILARVIQGIGAGGLVPLGEAILASRCTPSQRATLQVRITACDGLAAGMGPVLGGALCDVSWRWAFALIVPFCVAAGLAFFRKLRSDPLEGLKVPAPDLWGTVLLASGLVCVLVGIEQLAWLPLIFGTSLIIFFCKRSSGIRSGLIPHSVLSNRVTVACGVIVLLIGFIQFSYLSYLPSLAQMIDPGLNPGLVVIPLTVMWMTMGAVGAWLALRIGTKFVALLALCSAILASVLLLLERTIWTLLSAGALVGMAAALGVLSVLLLAQFSSASADLGATTSFIVLLRNCGGALGVSATLGVYDDYGLVPTLWVLAAVALIGVLPLMHLPSRLQEVAMGRAS